MTQVLRSKALLGFRRGPPSSAAGVSNRRDAGRVDVFRQQPPSLGNQYVEDVTLRTYLKRHVPAAILKTFEGDLHSFGQRVVGDLYQLHLECECSPPVFHQYDAWGNRIDEISTCFAWKQMHRISAEEGLVAIAYEREFAEYSRLYQMAKLFLFSPSSGLYSCPLAMTDGAAKVIETISPKEPWLTDRAASHLLSRDPSKFWTSGQWMTERRGGSDVASGTETTAVLQSDGSYRLYGYKWFTSAVDARMAFTLARVTDTKVTRGLDLFYVEMRDENGKLNNIRIEKLKNKLGTRQLPTAELLLDGTRAYKVSETGKGVSTISNMLTLTRIHNAVSAASAMRRIINLARDYATRRQAFGQYLKDLTLHVQTLSRLEVKARGATLLVMEVARLLGLKETDRALDSDLNLLRLLTPIAKLYTAKQAVAVISEGLECFGGQGYIEETGLPLMLRDAQVLPIWEGTTNILALDVLRAMKKSEVLQIFYDNIMDRLIPAEHHPELSQAFLKVKMAAATVMQFATENSDQLPAAASDFAFSLAQIYVGGLLIDHACYDEASPHDVLAAQRLCNQDLTHVMHECNEGSYLPPSLDSNFQLVFDGYHDKSRL